MSLINQMLKDLEKRRSRDLETSDSLSRNITWETRPGSKSVDWRILAVGTALVILSVLVVYLFWERSTYKSQVIAKAPAAVTQSAKIQKIKHQPVKHEQHAATSQPVKKPEKIKVAKEIPAPQPVVPKLKTTNAIDVDELENDKPVNLEKTRRPLSTTQLAEIAYNKGYSLLQQGRMRQGNENLRNALSLDKHHLKAREMLAGIYIRSGRYVEAAALLAEGVKIAPEYPLFAKLYARVLLEQNNPQQAIKVLEQGLRTANVAPDYQALLAATYQRVNEHEKAVEIYLRLLKFQPTAGVWWLGLAISLEKSGKNQEALDAYRRAQESGSLNASLLKFSSNRVSALKEIGFPVN